MIRAFFCDKKWALFAYGGGILLLILSYILVHLSVKFNMWYGGFYDIIQNIKEHTLDEYWNSLKQFGWIALQYIAVATIMDLITFFYAFAWREAITFNYVPKWRNVTEKIEGESQRIQEDPALYAEIVESLGLQAMNAAMTLFAFIPLLWGFGKHINFWILKDIPGSLVWIALVVSIGGLAITWFVAQRLPKLEYKNQVVEAAFRKELVLAEEDKVSFGSLPTILELFTGVKRNYYRLYWNKGYVSLWLNTYGQTMVIVPFIIVGPSLMAGIATLGLIMQIINSFGEVRTSLAVVINNWTRITRLRSIWIRLHEFETNLDKYQPQN